jgi:hypothetical protein
LNTDRQPVPQSSACGSDAGSCARPMSWEMQRLLRVEIDCGWPGDLASFCTAKVAFGGYW